MLLVGFRVQLYQGMMSMQHVCGYKQLECIACNYVVSYVELALL